jgi:hypothetical protein
VVGEAEARVEKPMHIAQRMESAAKVTNIFARAIDFENAKSKAQQENYDTRKSSRA